MKIQWGIGSQMRCLVALLTGAVILMTGCVGEFTLTQPATTSPSSGSTVPAGYNSLSFPGIDTIDQVGGVSVRLNWTHVIGASSYHIYDLTTGSPVFLASVLAPSVTYTVSGLTPLTPYKFRVNAIDQNGFKDQNTNDVQTATVAIVATHQGWSLINSVGAKVPVPQSGLASAPASVTLVWNPMTVSSGVVQSYNIYRATSSGGQNFSAPLATGLSAVTNSYTDSSVSAKTTYYYKIQPIVSGQLITPAPSADSEAKVIVPPSNMVLVHRWSANQEVCQLMGRSPDRANQYRCPYSGPGGTGSYFDMGASLWVDANEMGCNYTAAPGCGDAVNGCLGTAAPNNAVGNNNDVFYNRASATCYVKVAGTWTAANTNTLSSSARMILASNSPGLPPLTVINQARSADTCAAFSIVGFPGQKRLLSHKEQIIAAAWSTTLSDVTIDAIENGTNLNFSGYCNSNSGSGLVYDNLSTPANLETLPGTSASGIRSVRTGGTSTQSCVSRYGAQDLVGNVWEWSSDQLATCNAATHVCTGATSTLTPTNTDWNGFAFNGSTGPGANGVEPTEWDFAAMSFQATQFLVPLGLPVVAAAAASWDYLAIGTGAGQFDPAKFHADHFWLYTDTNNAVPARGSLSGGAWSNSAGAGRFSLLLKYMPTATGPSFGFRCALPAE